MDLCPKVAELVTSEFFEQGDRERSELKLIPAVSKPSSAHVSLGCFLGVSNSLTLGS